MSYMWCQVQWLAEHNLKSVIYQFTKLGRQTARDPKEGANILWSSSFCLESTLLEKNKQHYEKKKKSHNVLYLILGALG